MNKTITIIAGALIGIGAYAAPALAQDVGVSISLGQPGFYGRIELGDAPPPRMVYRQPMIVERQTVVEEPIYLHVRQGEAKHWKKHCRQYNACGRQVYFVDDNWYNTVYVKNRREHGDHGQQHHDERRDDRRDDRHDDRHDDRRDHDHHN